MTANFNTMTTKQLVDFYNAHSGKPEIKKFRDRETAIRRCSEIVVIDADETPLTFAAILEQQHAESSEFIPAPGHEHDEDDDGDLTKPAEYDPTVFGIEHHHLGAGRGRCGFGHCV